MATCFIMVLQPQYILTFKRKIVNGHRAYLQPILSMKILVDGMDMLDGLIIHINVWEGEMMQNDANIVCHYIYPMIKFHKDQEQNNNEQITRKNHKLRDRGKLAGGGLLFY